MRILGITAGLLAAMAIGVAQQDAKAFLKQVQQKYRNAKSWEMQVDITVETSFGGNMNRQQVRSTVAMQRPNRVAAKLGATMGMPERELYSDGRTMFVYVPSGKQYLRQPAPQNFSGGNLQFLGEAGLLIGLMEQNLDQIGPNAKFQFRGNQTVNGRQTRIVEISNSEGNSTTNVRLFVGANDQLIYRVELSQTMRGQGGQGSGQPQSINTKATANVRYLSFDRPIPAARFRFTPPKDAKEIKPPQQGQPQGRPQAPRGQGGGR
ncbi:MAG: hypothetical protein KatS3mg019_1912 [Fimbriimonadales bacterium]|nr:MAG: hypothetical protein KatS3mg019_1912 [Fimbriimonadales bacterium]